MAQAIVQLNIQRIGGALLAVWFLLLSVVQTPVYGQSFEEYHIKAVFLYNLLHFITWPGSEEIPYEQLTIAILGNDPFGEILDEAVKGETVGKRPVVVRRFTSFREYLDNPGEVLFVCSSQWKAWPAIRQELSGHPILTIGDIPNFAHQGGMINLLKSDSRIVIEVNREEIEQAGLLVSAKLLQLARLVP